MDYTYNMDLSQSNGPLDAYLHEQADNKVQELEQRLQQAREAVESMQEEDFIANELGLGTEEREIGHVLNWQRLLDALGITTRICSLCGMRYEGEHQC